MQSYQIYINFNKKKLTVKINVIQNNEKESYHYGLRVNSKEPLSEKEILSLRKYLDDEGYIDAAIKYYQS
jgi:hypothetical protein